MNDSTDPENLYNESMDKTQLGVPPGSDLKNTMPLSRKALLDDIKIKKQAQLEVTGLESGPTQKDLGVDDFIVGRNADCSLQIPVDDVSRHHARIFCSNEEYYVEDLGSTNGTYVNGISIVKCVLRSSDQVEIGDVKMIFTEVEMRDR